MKDYEDWLVEEITYWSLPRHIDIVARAYVIAYKECLRQFREMRDTGTKRVCSYCNNNGTKLVCDNCEGDWEKYSVPQMRDKEAAGREAEIGG
jgi:hypothetical protein